MKPTLYLHEETLLLALRDREGTVTASPHYLYALGGALLAELVLAQRVRLGPGRRSPRVELVNPAPIGEVLLDECLTRIAHAKRARSARDWVMRFASLKRLKHRVAAELCQRGILRADQGRVLLLFRRRIYPEIDPGPERALVQRLRQAIFGAGADLEARTEMLLALAQRAGLLERVFDKRKLKERRARIAQITLGNPLGQAVEEAIQAAAAAMAAVGVCAG